MPLLQEPADRGIAFQADGNLVRMPRFRICIERADPDIASDDPKVGVAALNRDIERIARRDLAQYQWTYKRYTLRPPGSGEDNPYRDFEKHSRP